MNYAIVYTSKTGNTDLLARRLAAALPAEHCVYSGAPGEAAKAADLIFAGFWTDKGSCDEEMAAFLKSLEGKQIFLFGTAGFGGSEAYFGQILARVKALIAPSNQVVGSYMCQGKMPATVRKRYESMLEQDPTRMQGLIDNFDKALPHPNEADLNGLEQAVELLKKEF